MNETCPPAHYTCITCGKPCPPNDDTCSYACTLAYIRDEVKIYPHHPWWSFLAKLHGITTAEKKTETPPATKEVS